ncbi:ergosterol biosynthesis protein [Dimargaris xerosporica]|nr:ergosterol biosynthesis protein [Dimargaris xerosporica]
MEAISAWLPQDEGLLPKWLWLVAVVSIFNTLQTYIQPLVLTRRLYNAQPHQVTPLTARFFGCWTLVSAVVRFYGAYNLRNPVMFSLLVWTFAIAFTHYFTEIVVFRSARLLGPALSPVVVATTSLVWMWSTYEYYLGPRPFA